MCQAFSAIVLKNGEVLWELGIDSHSSLLEKHQIKDDTAKKEELQFARVEIAPKNGSYLKPDEWEFTLDERIRPTWWNNAYKQYTYDAWKEWKKELGEILVYKEIINPFEDVTPPKKITKKHVSQLKIWASVRDSVRASVWGSVGASVRDSVGDSVWGSVRDSVGDSVWGSVGDSVGASVWDSVRDSAWASAWDSVGASVRASVRASVGDSVWGYIGSFFNLPRSTWKHTKNIKTTDYPFQSVVNLWEQGLVPSFDGEIWRLHGGKDAKVLWEGKIK